MSEKIPDADAIESLEFSGHDDDRASLLNPEKETKELEKKLPPALFIQAPYGGDAIQFRGEPTSLLYAVSVFAEKIHIGEIDGLDDSGLKIMNPAVFDEKFETDLRSYIEENKPKVIGISCTTSSSVPAKEIARIAKEMSRSLGYEIITIMGGAHERDMSSMLPGSTSAEQKDFVDFSATGESEETFNQLLSMVYGNSPERIASLTAYELKNQLLTDDVQTLFKQLNGRNGGFTFRLNGELHSVTTNGKMVDYENIPPLPRHLLEEKWTKYYGIFRKNGRDVKTAQIMSCRGCARKCRFCSETLNFNPKDSEIVLKELDQIANASGEKYRAVFFDDSTFTAFTRGGSNPDGSLRPERTVENLRPIFAKLKELGMEWGCQTRVDCINEELLQEMKEAGCTYIYLGVESADQDILNAMAKGVKVEQIEKAIDAIDAVDIRIGMSLMFGSEGKSNGRDISETTESVDKTLAFVKKKLDEGKRISLVSMNLYTYYPHSTATEKMPRDEKIRLAQESYPDRDDLGSLADEELLRLMFEKPIVHHGYPWNRFEDGQGHHPACVDENLARYIVEKGVREIGEVLQGQDLYTVNEIYEEIRTGRLSDFIDFNHSSLTTPRFDERQKKYIEKGGKILVWGDRGLRSVSVFGESATVHQKGIAADYDFGLFLSFRRARRLAAEMFGVSGRYPERNIAFAPNTTQAINLAFCMAVLVDEIAPDTFLTKWGKLYDQLTGKVVREIGGTIVVTDAENFSVRRIPKVLADQGNPDGRDDWSAFQDFGSKSQIIKPMLPTSQQKLNFKVKEAKILHGGITDQVSIEDEIVEQVDQDTKVVIFSHVIRDDGRIVDTKKVCKDIRRRNPNCWIIVDGAQAMGALAKEKLDVESIDCDFYVATPHKTLNSYPFGMLYMSERGKSRVDPFVKKSILAQISFPIPWGTFDTGAVGVHEEKILQRIYGIISPMEVRSYIANFDPLLTGEELTESEQGLIKSLGLDGIQLPSFPTSSTYPYPDPDELISERMPERLEKFEQVRSVIKSFAIDRLSHQFSNIDIVSPSDEHHSNFILSFRFPGQDNRQIVDKLWRLPKPIALSYIARTDLIRISFDQFNTNEEIDELVKAMNEVVTQNQKIN